MITLESDYPIPALVMTLQITSENFYQLCDGLAARDKELSQIIREHGYPPLWNRPNTFESLVHIILEQQVSLASALAALNKLKERLQEVTPESFLLLTDEELRSCYFSRQKTIYTRGLAKALAEGTLNLHGLTTLDDAAVRNKLVTLKGIGNWTVDIYLLFVLQRANIFPMGDLAAINALKRIKKLPKDTSHEKLLAITSKWHPHKSAATMLLWHHYLSSPRKK